MNNDRKEAAILERQRQSMLDALKQLTIFVTDQYTAIADGRSTEFETRRLLQVHVPNVVEAAYAFGLSGITRNIIGDIQQTLNPMRKDITRLELLAAELPPMPPVVAPDEIGLDSKVVILPAIDGVCDTGDTGIVAEYPYGGQEGYALVVFDKPKGDQNHYPFRTSELKLRATRTEDKPITPPVQTHAHPHVRGGLRAGSFGHYPGDDITHGHEVKKGQQ